MKRPTPKTRKTTKPVATPKKAVTDSPMDVGLLQQIISLMSANDLNTVDLRDGEKRIVLNRGPNFVTAGPAQQMYAAPQAPASSVQAPAPVADESNLIPIKSPMVGTFYAKASPDAKPFISVGARVDDDTDVCIIEAMKVFNNIKAECRGTVEKVLVQDRATVEFGQVLFLVKP